jgi:hypothetical protein
MRDGTDTATLPALLERDESSSVRFNQNTLGVDFNVG